jgi:fructose-bisphosphate aldolase, class I
MRASWAHKIPFIVKINHNELLSYPNKYEQILFAQVEQAWELGAAAVGATIYFGSEDFAPRAGRDRRMLRPRPRAGDGVHPVVLPAQLRVQEGGVDFHGAADLTGQANHLGVTIEADIIKQKLATNNGGYPALGFGKTHQRVYGELVSDHPSTWCAGRWPTATWGAWA